MSDELDIIMGVYIDSGKYNDEELEKIRKLQKKRLEDDEDFKIEIAGKKRTKTSWDEVPERAGDVLDIVYDATIRKPWLGTKVSAGNVLNAIDPTGGKALDFIASGFDINELMDDEKVGDIGDAWIDEQKIEFEKLTEKAMYTDVGLGIARGIKQGSIPDIALGMFNAISSGIGTIGPAIISRGKTLPPQIMAPMYVEYNNEKAKILYPEDKFSDAIKKLRENDEEEVLIPVALGLLSVVSERVGVKGVRSAMNNTIINGGKTIMARNAAVMLATGSREAVTEYIQHGLQIANISQAQQDSWETTAQKMWDGMVSIDGLEAGLQGFVAGGAIAGGGRAIQSALRTESDNKIVNNYVENIAVLNQKRREAYDPRVKEKYDNDILTLENQLQDILVLNRKRSTYLTKDQTNELVDILNSKKDLQSEVIRLNKQRRRGIINKEQYNDSLQEINNERQTKDQRINDIKVEANKKLLHDELRITEEAISRIPGLEIEVLKTNGDYFKAVNAKLKMLGQKPYILEELEGSDGVIIGNKILINEVVAAETNAISVGSHELLHAVIKSSLNGPIRTIGKDANGNDITTDLTVEGEQLIRNFVNSLSAREKAIVQKRINDNYKFNKDGTEKQFAEYAEEYIPLYSDAAIKNELTPGIVGKLKNFLEKIFNKGDKGYKDLGFESGQDVKNFLKAYVSDRKKGRFREQFIKMAQKGTEMGEDGIIKRSIIKRDKTPKERKKAINDIGKTYYDKDLRETISFEQLGGNAYWEMYSGKAKGFKDKITKEIREQGLLDGVILEKYKNYKKNLDKANVTEKEFLNTVYAELVPHIRNYKPEKQLEYAEKDRTGLNGWIMPQIGNKSLQAFNILTKGETQAPTVPVGQTTKEGDIKVQVEADVDQAMIDLETMDMSPQAIAKRETQKNKKKEVRKSKLRQDYGVEDGSDIYNSVLNSARQSLILAYQKTRDIKNKNDRAAAIVKMIADEYAGEKGLTSGRYTELFKQVKNSLGTKEYINNLKKNRESIVESIFTSDFVQIERNVPDSEKIFTKFVKKLTSKQEVQDAVDKGLLPKDSLKAIDKGQAVNLYDKVMPTPNQFVGFFDQPLTVEKTDKEGKVYYVRSGLKGTRKDGLSKHMSKAFIFDALMEVRQEPGVNEMLTNEFNAELDIVDLASKISRDVNVKFSKSTANRDIDNAINLGANPDVYNQIRFSKSHRDQYEKRLEKNRTDLTEEQRKNAVQSVFDFVDGKEIPNHLKSKYEKMAMHYMANGNLILPEDGYKVIEVERLAAKNKIDPFSVKDPSVILQKFVEDSKSKRTNPDTVKTFSNKTELSNNVVVYDVEDSKQGQLDVRKVADTHFGPKFNNWCLIHRKKPFEMSKIDYWADQGVFWQENNEFYTKKEALIEAKKHRGLGATVQESQYMYEGKPMYEVHAQYGLDKIHPVHKVYFDDAIIPPVTKDPDMLSDAFLNWETYNATGEGFKIAFHNGKLVAFRDGNDMQWWDINDKSTPGIVIKGKKDKDSFKPVIEVEENKETLLYYEKGSSKIKNGTHVIKDINGTTTEQTPYKNGKKHGVATKTDWETFETTATEKSIWKQGEQIENEKTIIEGKDNRYLITEFIGDHLDKSEVINSDGESVGGFLNLENITIKHTVDYSVHITDKETVINTSWINTYEIKAINKTTGENITYIESHQGGRVIERSYNGEQFLLESDILANPLYFEGETLEKFNIPLPQALEVKKKYASPSEVHDDITIARSNAIKFHRSKKYALTKLQLKKKPLPAILGEMQKIDERINNGTEDDVDNYLESRAILENMQELFEEGVPATEIYNILTNAFPSGTTSLGPNLSSVENFIQFIKKTSIPRIRSIGFEASKEHLTNKLKGIEDKDEKIRIINEFLINVGRSARDNYKEQGITTNRQLYNQVLIPLESIVGKNFIKNNYALEKINIITKGEKAIGERMVFKDKKGVVKIDNVMYSIVPLYESIINIKMNARSNKDIVKKVNEEARLATEYVMSIINDPVLTNAEKLAIIDLMSLSQRGAIRKMYKMGITLVDNKKTAKLTSEDLVLEHEVTISNMVDHLQNRVKQGETYQKKLDEAIDRAKVHVLPKDIDALLNMYGLRSKGGFIRYTYNEEIVNFFAKEFKNEIIEAIPESVSEIYNNQNISNVRIAASKSINKPTKGISILDFDDTLATTKSVIRFTRPDGTKGELSASQYASTYEDLLELGYKFDFSEFEKVVKGKPAPLLNKAKKLAEKFGTKDMFILTARPPESVVAIHKFLKENGLKIPLKNIVGLGNSTSDAKAAWVLNKASEGYNDFYFADDAIQNVEAVQNMLDQIDVKSKVQQARVKFSKSRINEYFNGIIRDVSGIDINQRFSEAQAKIHGRHKGKFRPFIPPSHEDFVGLLYNFMGRGKKGDNARDFFQKTLIKPLNEAYRRLNAHKQVIANNYKKLTKHMPQVSGILSEKVPSGDFTYEDAIRIYLWNKSGYKIPGLTKEQENVLVNLVKSHPELQKFADHLGRISLIKEGYTTPGDSWIMGNIKFDLVDATGRVGRAKFFQKFIENSEIIFGKLDSSGKLHGDNINKIEAIFGENFREALEDHLYRTINGTNRKSGSNKLVNAWFDWINGSVGAVMFFNMRSAVLQQLSFVNFMNFADNNIFKASARFADQPQFWDDFAYLFNSDYLKQRRTGAAFDVNANEIAREVSGARHPVRVAIRKILDFGFTPTQMGDSFAIAIGGAGFYRNRINTYLKQGFSQKEAESKAFLDFQETAEATQQSARPDMISSQQAGPLGRFILAFQNVTSQYARIVKKSGLDLINRRISRGYTNQEQSDTANISRIIYYGAIQSMIFYGLQQALFAMLFSDEEDDEEFFKTKKDRVINGTVDSLLRGIGVHGAVIATLKNYVFKYVANNKSDSFFKTPAWEELLQVSPPIGIKFRKWRSMERTLEWNKDVIKNMSIFDIDNPIYEAFTIGTEGFTNIPLNRLWRKIENLRASFDSENAWWQRVATGLGWSKWDVGIETKETLSEERKKYKDKGKDKGREDKSQEKENKKLQEKEREEGGKVGCIAVSRKGKRCKNEALSNESYCTIHVKVEKNKSGEKKRCRKTKSNGERCKMKTAAKSGYCYYHD